MSCMTCSTPESCRRKGMCCGSTANTGTKPMNYVRPMVVRKPSKKKVVKIK